MSEGYLIAHLKEHDPEGMEKFKQMSGPTIKVLFWLCCLSK